MLPVGDPLKDSGSSEEGESSKQMESFFFSHVRLYTRNKNAVTNYYRK